MTYFGKGMDKRMRMRKLNRNGSKRLGHDKNLEMAEREKFGSELKD